MVFNNDIAFTSFSIHHLNNLLTYLEKLSPETKKRFGPHAYTKHAILEKFDHSDQFQLYIAVKPEEIVAYSIVKFGWLNFDATRLYTYGIKPEKFDCTFAPSVADQWQSKRVGFRFFNYVAKRLKTERQIKRFILWGGVQADNYKALGFYRKLGFKELGSFSYNGKNYDMKLDL